MLTIKQLKSHANKFLGENYGLQLEVPLQLNSRMKTTYGWFRHKRTAGVVNKGAVCIELSKFFVENNDEQTVLDILNHELVHYALYMLDKPYKDGHPVFEKELKKLGIVSQSNIAKKHTIKDKPRNMHVYQCQRCNHKHHLGRQLKFDGKFHSCNCGGKLISQGRKLVSM